MTNDRPMRQMSLRAFRDSIADQTSPVEVSKREDDGNIRVLGFWTPYNRHPVASLGPLPAVRLELPIDDAEVVPVVINSPADVATAIRVDPVRAVPKPSQQKRKR